VTKISGVLKPIVHPSGDKLLTKEMRKQRIREACAAHAHSGTSALDVLTASSLDARAFTQELAKIGVPQGGHFYLPTNPASELVSIVVNSGTPMQVGALHSRPPSDWPLWLTVRAHAECGQGADPRGLQVPADLAGARLPPSSQELCGAGGVCQRGAVFALAGEASPAGHHEHSAARARGERPRTRRLRLSISPMVARAAIRAAPVGVA
jgi:hypothetical protein